MTLKAVQWARTAYSGERDRRFRLGRGSSRALVAHNRVSFDKVRRCLAATASRQALKSLYHSRWQVELDIRSIKTTLGMETLSCKTPEMAKKEMWVYLLAYNLIRIIMAQSAKLANVLPRCLSFKHTLQLWLAWSRQPAPTYEEPYLMELFRLVSAQRRGNRPGRIEPRAVKRRPKPFSLLTCPRREAQALIRKNGHPPKRREWHRTAQCDSKQSRAA